MKGSTELIRKIIRESDKEIDFFFVILESIVDSLNGISFRPRLL